MDNLRQVAAYVQIFAPLLLLAIGFGIWIWLWPIPDDELTTAQSDMLTTADWIIKVSVGVLLGLGSNAGIRSISGNGKAT